MQATASQSTTKPEVNYTTVPAPTRQLYVFILELKDGRIAVGQGTNPSKRISTINSGLNASLPHSLCVNRIVGIKEVTETRNIVSVCKQLIDVYGEDIVIAV
jgi:predicted GIY-YIG superfamily endonuclease